MTKVRYTQIIFTTPQARVEYSEVSLEMKAEKVAKVYRGLANDHNDGEFALWNEFDLIEAIIDLEDEIAELARAREAAAAA